MFLSTLNPQPVWFYEPFKRRYKISNFFSTSAIDLIFCSLNPKKKPCNFLEIFLITWRTYFIIMTPHHSPFFPPPPPFIMQSHPIPPLSHTNIMSREIVDLKEKINFIDFFLRYIIIYISIHLTYCNLMALVV